jgi:hypothetical protein
MHARQLLDLRSGVEKNSLIFFHSGFVTEKMLEGAGEALRRQLQCEGVDGKTARNLFAIFVEQMQNIIRYSSEFASNHGQCEAGELRHGSIAVGTEDDRYFVACANMVPRADVDRLRRRLDEIRASDTERLKRMYRDKLRTPAEATSKGAGVGFIEMARRSDEPIEFEFMDLDEERALFCLKVFA